MLHPALFFFLNAIFAVQGHLWGHMNVSVLFLFLTVAIVILIGIALKERVASGPIDIVTIRRFPKPEHKMSSQSLVVFSVQGFHFFGEVFSSF